MDCGEVRSDHIVEFASELLAGGRQPSTVGNYISHLSAVFSIARPAWGYQLDEEQMTDAQIVLRQMGIALVRNGKNDSAGRICIGSQIVAKLATVCAPKTDR